jgi:hypothetical protein
LQISRSLPARLGEGKREAVIGDEGFDLIFVYNFIFIKHFSFLSNVHVYIYALGVYAYLLPLTERHREWNGERKDFLILVFKWDFFTLYS